MKELRNKGHQVTVVPNNGTKLYYLMRKGYVDFFKDPLVLLVLGIPLTFVVNIISGLVMRRLTRPELKSPEVHLILETEQNGKKKRFDYQGNPLTDDQFKSILSAYRAEQQNYEKSSQKVAPEPSLPKPIFLEHTNKIVGWGRVWVEEKGALMARARIIDDDTWQAILEGELVGYSMGGLVGKTICSVCKQDYLFCNHMAGEKYRDIDCTVELRDVELAEISIVSDPVQVHIPFLRAEQRNVSNYHYGAP